MAGGQQWRGVVNGVLYMAQFEAVLDDEQVIAARAEQFVAQPVFDRTVADNLAALRAGLASGEQLSAGIPLPHDEATVRRFLTGLADRVEALAPWPAQPYRKLPAHQHPELLTAPAVGSLALDWKPAADRLGRSIDRAGDHAVLVLELGSGDTVALLDDWDITPRGGHRDGRCTLVSASAAPAADVLAAFRAATGFTAAEVTPR